MTEGYAAVYMWRPEESLQKIVLSFHPVGPREQNQVINLSDN